MDLKSNDNAVQGTSVSNNNAQMVNTPNPSPKAQGNDKAKTNEQPKTEPKGNEAAAPKAAAEKETPRANQLQAPEPHKPAMSITDKLKALETLQVRVTQYENLLGRIKDLEDFEFKQMEENDELQENYFAGCRIILQDGNKGQFTTTTPNLVKMVHAFLKAACLDKKAELEEAIVFPA